MADFIFYSVFWIAMVLKKQIDTVLGYRSPNCKYMNSDVLLGHFASVIAGGAALEDVNRMRTELEDVADVRIPSADTLARVLRDLTCSKTEVINQAGNINQLVDNEMLNELLCALSARLLKHEIEPTLDIDAHLVVCDKPDADYAYTKEKGYFPMVALVNRCPVYVQNRSGNTAPAFGQVEFAKKVLDQAKKQGVNIKNFRADAASYNLELMHYLDKTNIRFYIRAARPESLTKEIVSIAEKNWKKAIINKREIEVAEMDYKGYRLVVERSKTGDQLDVFSGTSYMYRAVITNDFRVSMLPQDVIHFYNQRGDAERNFDMLGNDFGWSLLPFNDIGTNTTYLIAAACCMALFELLKYGLSKLCKQVWTTMRPKSFVLNFLAIPAKVIYRSRTRFIQFYTQLRFKDLEMLVT